MPRGQLNIGRRFMWWPPWALTRPWLPRVSLRGGWNEWCVGSVRLVLPFLGAFIVFHGPLRDFPCDECWALLDDEARADYLPGGYLEGGRVHPDRLEVA